jgi:hypothetical protein
VAGRKQKLDPDRATTIYAKPEPLFPITSERAQHIQSLYQGAYRHLAAHVFQALAVLERSQATEADIAELLPKLRTYAQNVASQSGEPDVYLNGLAWARNAIAAVYCEHRDSGGKLNGFQVLAIGVLGYGDAFTLLQREAPSNWELHTDIALQMSILATRLAQETSALVTAIGADNSYEEIRRKRALTGTNTIIARKRKWQKDAIDEAETILRNSLLKPKALPVAERIRTKWLNEKRHLIPHLDKVSGSTVSEPPKAGTIAREIGHLFEKLDRPKPLRETAKPVSRLFVGMR